MFESLVAISFSDTHVPKVLAFVFIVVAIIFLPRMVTVAIHELGHVVGALLTRCRIFEISVGDYERQSAGRWFGRVLVRFSWNALNAGGYVVVLPKSSRFYRMRALVVLAAGPAFSLCYLCFLAWLCLQWNSSPPRFVSVSVPISLLIYEVFAMTGYLIPRRVEVGGIQSGTDMLQIWWLITQGIDLKRAEHQFAGCEAHYLIASGRFEQAEPWIQRLTEVPTEALPFSEQLAWASMFLNFGKFDEAERIASRILRDGSASRDSDVIWKAADTLGCSAVYRLDAGAAPTAIPHLEKAVAENPQIVTLQGTLGALWYLVGDLEKAETILRRVISGSKAATDIGISAAFLSRIAGKRGDSKLAAQLNKSAMRNAGSFQFLKRLLSETD